MSNLITGCNLPADLLAVLRKYGMPDRCTKFAIRCDGQDELLTLSYEGYMREPEGGEAYPDVVEARAFKLLAID